MTDNYDVIVLGLGGMGAAAAAELARRGRRVLGLERFSFAHDRGSSHGQTRIIRTAYFEHPDYVPLVRRAFSGWYALEQRQGAPLLTECDLVTIARPDSELRAGVLASAEQHGLPIEHLSPSELRRRFPAFTFDDSFLGVVEGSAGFLRVEDCLHTLLREAGALGAELHAEEPALSWGASDKAVAVHTARGEYRAAALVITAGPWARQLLGRWGKSLSLMRQVMLWFAPPDPAPFRRDVFPIFLVDVPGGPFYGLPAIDPAGMKVARHYGAPTVTSPDEVSREVTDEDEQAVRAFLRKHIPGADGPRARGSVCIYTLTPDHHFLIDHHPEHAHVALAAGFSGHGFKFAPVVGEILADLVEKGETDLPAGMFRLGRLAPPA
jgi:sarcosine oxidase